MRKTIGVYGDVSRLSGQRYRFSGTGAFLAKEGTFECLRVKTVMYPAFLQKGIDSKRYTPYTINRGSNRWEMVK